MKRDKFWKGPPKDVLAWCALTREGELMPASCCDTNVQVRLRCGPDCVPVLVKISYVELDPE